MLNKKDFKNSKEALEEIKKTFQDDGITLKDGLQRHDIEKPFAVVIKNGEIIYKTYNPLQNGVYVGDEKLKLEWDLDPTNTDITIDVTQNLNDDMKLIFSLDGNIINEFESKPGERNMTAKLQLRMKL